jgi:Cu/Ag efflux protein CusF
MKKPMIILGAAMLGALALPALAQPKPDTKVLATTEPGKVAIATTTKVTATVQAIDKATRKVTLKGADGKVFTITASPEVRNLDQVKVGDVVAVGYAEALSLTLKKDGKELPSKVESQDGARTAAGQKPGGVVAKQTQVTADVIAIDAKTQTVTLRGPEQTVDLKVRDPEQFKLIKVGDQIQAVYTEALALTVEPVAPVKK